MQTTALQALGANLPSHMHRSQFLRTSVASANNGPASPLPMHTPPLNRKRKRVQHYAVCYSEVQEIDTQGRVRDIIVIDDTPPPATLSPALSASTQVNGFSMSYQPPAYGAPVRTRARAAAEAQAASSSASTALAAPAPKKRKRDPVDEAVLSQKRPPPGQKTNHIVAQAKAGVAAGSHNNTDDVRLVFMSAHLAL